MPTSWLELVTVKTYSYVSCTQTPLQLQSLQKWWEVNFQRPLTANLDGNTPGNMGHVHPPCRWPKFFKFCFWVPIHLNVRNFDGFQATQVAIVLHRAWNRGRWRKLFSIIQEVVVLQQWNFFFFTALTFFRKTVKTTLWSFLVFKMTIWKFSWILGVYLTLYRPLNST